MSQKLISLGDICNQTNKFSENVSINLQEERLKQIECDVSYAVSLIRSFAVNGVKDRNRTLMTENNIKKHVAFTAGATNSNSMGSSTLLFNRLIYGIGGGYDTSTGVFTSPETGVFVFFVVAVSESDSDLYLNIMLIGDAKVITMSWYPTGTQTGDRL
ncbi:uncharacterized protein LOC134258918 [Saccostrea cucullata]|uniref:uncharacterized protein LOC134258918 n=1 Tax=Saccostrea cuccullata TaxID=36930 RepID=UPI002ED185D6